jgi:predicted transcriptional regulator
MMVTKQAMLEAIAQLPDDATIEDAMERLYILEGIERGIAQVEAGQVLTNDEAKKRLSTWLK